MRVVCDGTQASLDLRPVPAKILKMELSGKAPTSLVSSGTQISTLHLDLRISEVITPK
jgi:hypothetical protein